MDYPPPPGRPRRPPGSRAGRTKDQPHDGRLRGRDVRELRQSARSRPSSRPSNQPRQPGQPADPGRSARTGPPPSGTATDRDNLILAGKAIAAAVSVTVLMASGYGWATFQNLNNGLTTTDVIGKLTAADGATDILLVGNDSRVDAQGNPLPPEVLAQLRAGDNEGELTDTLILLRIPNDGTRAVGISLPRDTYVDIPGPYGKHKINSAYGRAKTATAEELRSEGEDDPAAVEREAVLEGRKTLVRTIESLTGAGIDHYAEVNLLGFYEITNAVGGVEVCLKNPVREYKSGANFPAGRQRISGGDALAFVRQRDGLPRGDLDRVVRQQVFLGALADQVLSAGTLANPGKLTDLVGSLQRSVVLDEGWDVLRFAQQVQGVAAGNIEFVTIPITGNDRVDGDGAVLTVDPRDVRDFVRSKTEAPADPDQGDPDQGQPTLDSATITVDVRNAAGVSGLAGRVLDELAGGGFTRGEAANAASRAASVVRHATGEEEAGRRVAEALGGLPVESDANLAAGRVSVFLGEDYSGPGTQQLSAGPLLRLDGLSGLDGTAQGVRQAQPPNGDVPITAGNIPCVD